MKSLAFIILGLAAGLLVAFVVMKSGYRVSVDKVSQTSSASPSAQLGSSTPAPKAQTTPAPAQNTISAGGKLVFVKYEVSYPTTWQAIKTSSYQDQETITLINGDYKITINQSASGGALCAYPDAPTDAMSVSFKYFVDIKAKDGTSLRRSGDSATSTSFTVCSNVSGSGIGQGSFGDLTPYGHIDITVPTSPNPAKLSEIDQILSSLKKI